MADRAPRDLRRTLRAVFPTGGRLPPDVWRHRHRWILGLLWAHIPAILVFGLTQGVPLRHLALEVLPVAVLAAGGARLSTVKPRWAAAITAVGLATCSAVLVHLSGGAIEMHFHFFVMVGVVTLYQDWWPFLACIAYVVVHHSVVGSLEPESVFNHPAALHSPFRWALIHGGFILAMSAVGLVSWRLNELTAERLADREKKLAHAQAVAGLGSWEWDVPTGEIEWSPELFRLFGLEVGAITPSYEAFIARVHPEDQPVVNAAVAHSHQTLEPFNFDFRAVLPGGGERWMHSQGEVVEHDGGTPTLLYGTAHDITSRKLAERDLMANQRATRLIQDVAVAANQATSLDHAMRSGLIAVCEFTGWPAGRFHLVTDDGDLQSTGLAWAGDREHRRFLDLVESSPAADDDLPRSVWRSGRPAWSSLVGTADPVVGEAAHEIGLAGRFALPVAAAHDVVAVFEFFTEDDEGPDDAIIHLLENVVTQLGRVVERREAQEALAHQAHHDSLTELPNRVLFLDRLGYELRRQTRDPSTLGVLFMDLDGFKVINDSLGHDAGDTILVAIADRLRGAVREGDTIARFGGDEFAVLAPAVGGEADLVVLADRIATAFTPPFPVGEDREFVVTASIGIAVAEDPDTDPAALLRDADLAMYRAKEQGRARHALFDTSMHAAANERLSMATSLRRAVDVGELCLHYQPQIVLGSDSTIAGVEALLRWEHPERGLISPAEIIPVAEATGLIVPIGSWVIEEAARQLGEWQRTGRPDLAMCVNVSARQLVDDAIVAVVARALDENGVIPSTLCLEITESVLMEDPDHYADTLSQLKALGVSLSVDDFGTGYSSLAYLQVLPADFLKVDRSFVERLGTSPRAAAIVGTIIDLAHSLDLGVVAEGVETEEQADELTRLHCDQAQGFLFARPAPAAEITPMLGLRTPALR